MKYLLIFFAIFAVVIIVIAISFASGVISVLPKEIAQYGQLGDFFGGTLNPIFAFFAFLTLLYTVYLQSETLKVSRKELLATKEELEKSRIAQEKQSDSLELQNQATSLQIFENTFFKLMELFINLRNGLSIKVDIFENNNGYGNGSGGQYTEYSGIHDDDFYVLDCIKTSMFMSYEVIEKYLIIFTKRYKIWGYDEFNSKYEKYTGTYFSQVYQIIKFIDKSNLNDNKQRYINIFRAQFTKDELEFLFYHCLGTIGKRRFKKLVEDYEFFEHIILNENIEKQLLEYDINAFGKNENILKRYYELKEKAKTEEIPAFVKAE
jgi:hypothetical protein